MRVLTTWLRWGVLYRFPMGINSFHLPPFCGRFFKYFLVGFSSGTSRIAGFGEGTPQHDLPKGQNRRYADFGTVVESCSKKLPLSSAALVCGYTGLLHQYSDCGGVFCPLFTTTTVKRGRFGKRSGNFFVFPVCSLQQSGGVVCQRFLKMGAKKAVNLFKIYCLSAAVMGGGIKLSAVFQMEFICNRFLSAFQFLFCNLP